MSNQSQGTGPYIVTTKSRYDGANDLAHLAVKSRHAVAALEDAREVAANSINSRDWHNHRTAIYTLPDTGGIIGPLPDGSVIEVEPCETVALAREAGVYHPESCSVHEAVVIWNEVCSS